MTSNLTNLTCRPTDPGTRKDPILGAQGQMPESMKWLLWSNPARRTPTHTPNPKHSIPNHEPQTSPALVPKNPEPETPYLPTFRNPKTPNLPKPQTLNPNPRDPQRKVSGPSENWRLNRSRRPIGADAGSTCSGRVWGFRVQNFRGQTLNPKFRGCDFRVQSVQGLLNN